MSGEGAISTQSGAARKEFRVGTDRVVTPEETLARVKPAMRAMGITRIANLTGLDRVGIPTVAVARPNARSLAVSQGKGVSLAAAQASGLMESVESYHAEHVELPLRLASARELARREELILLAGLPRARASTFHPDLRMLWLEGRDLVSGRPLWLPYELVHLDLRAPLPPGHGAFFLSSNGLASGNHVLEATSHALCELVERDANTLWHFSGESGHAARRVDPASVTDSICRSLLAAFEDARIDVAIWETTSEIGLAAFMCHIADRSPDPAAPMLPAYGSGCHPRREVALSRALTEAAQCRLTAISGARDDLGAELYDPDEVWLRLERFRRRFDAQAPRNFLDVPSYEGQSVEDDVVWELSALCRAGFDQAVLVELTKAEFGIPVVRVVVPGLEAIGEAPGYEPGARARAARGQA